MSKLQELLQGFDWYYNYSDCNRTYQEGSKRYQEIICFLRDNPSYNEEFEKARELNMGSTSMSNF